MTSATESHLFVTGPILIVEDDPMIAFALAAAVEDHHGEVIGPLGSVIDALALLDRMTVAAAILDARLADRDITPVALRLADADVPIVMHTGTGLPAELARLYPELIVMMKPASPEAVVMSLLGEIGRRG